MVDVEKLAAVREFLQAEFPGCRIEDRPESSGQRIQIGFQGATYVVILSDDFLRDHDRSEIGGKLSRFTLIEHLREMPGTPIIVTSGGLGLEYE